MHKERFNEEYPILARKFEALLYAEGRPEKYANLAYDYKTQRRGISLETIFQMLSVDAGMKIIVSFPDVSIDCTDRMTGKKNPRPNLPMPTMVQNVAPTVAPSYVPKPKYDHRAEEKNYRKSVGGSF